MSDEERSSTRQVLYLSWTCSTSIVTAFDSRGASLARFHDQPQATVGDTLIGLDQAQRVSALKPGPVFSWQGEARNLRLTLRSTVHTTLK